MSKSTYGVSIALTWLGSRRSRTGSFVDVSCTIVTGTVTGPSSSVAVTVSCRVTSSPMAGSGAANRTVASAVSPAGTSTTDGTKSSITTPSGSDAVRRYRRGWFAARLSRRTAKAPWPRSTRRTSVGCATSVAGGPNGGTTTVIGTSAACVVSTPDLTDNVTSIRWAIASDIGRTASVTCTVRVSSGRRLVSLCATVSHEGGSSTWIT